MTASNEYDPDRPLDTSVSHYLRTRIQSRRDEVGWYLSLERRREDWDVAMANADKISNLIFNYAENLGGSNESLATRLAQHSDLNPNDSPLILEAVHERLAETVLASLEVGEGRIVKLFQMIRYSEHSDLALHFLKRIGRCFLFGLDLECLVMCRAALESTLIDIIPDDELRGRFPDYVENLKWKGQKSDDQIRWPLDKLIKAAGSNHNGYERWFSDDAKNFADKIRWDANDALHSGSNSGVQLKRCIDDYVTGLLKILNELAMNHE